MRKEVIIGERVREVMQEQNMDAAEFAVEVKQFRGCVKRVGRLQYAGGGTIIVGVCVIVLFFAFFAEHFAFLALKNSNRKVRKGGAKFAKI